MRGFFGLSVLLSLVGGSVASANEIEDLGFRLGTPIAKVRQMAVEKGYTLSNLDTHMDSDRMVAYALQKNKENGPNLWFCDKALFAVTVDRRSSLHEITSTVKDWKSAYGEPQVEPRSYYREGAQVSQIEFKWLGEENIQRDITMAQFDQSQTHVSFSYSYIKSPCRP